MSKKLPLKQIIINLGIFRSELLVIISEDREHVARVLHHQHGDCHEDFKFKTCDAACFYAPGKSPILWIQKYPTTPKEYGTLVHEACHITTYVLEECCIKTSHDDGETYSYLTEYIVEQILLKKEVKFMPEFYDKSNE